MDLSWNDRRTRQFLTNVGFITSDGPYGPNVMTAEWLDGLLWKESKKMIKGYPVFLGARR